MQIQIIDVGTPNTKPSKNGRSYQEIEVTYKSQDGKVTSKKLMSFSNPSVFKTVSTLNKGDTVEVTTEKVGDYWQWTAINQGGAAPMQQTQSTGAGTSSGSTRVTGSNYETKEERAARQELIVRQSSLSAAVSILTVGSKSVDKDAVKTLAQELADWVFQKDNTKTVASIDAELEEFKDDIPY
jgi:hypothetical protein